MHSSVGQRQTIFTPGRLLFLAPFERRRRNHIFRSDFLQNMHISQETSTAHSLNSALVLVKTYLMKKKLNSAPGAADELPRRKAEQSRPVKKREIKFVFLFEYKFLICIFPFLIAGVVCLPSDIRGGECTVAELHSLASTLRLFYLIFFLF